LKYGREQFIVDVIEFTYEKDHNVKDKIIIKYVEFNPKILQYVKLVKKWVNSNKNYFDSTKGYPNS